MEEMKSRERVYAAVNHKEPDRVPICFGGISAAGIQEGPPDACLGASALYNYLGIKDSKPGVGPVGNITYGIDERVIKRLHSDMHAIYANAPVDIIIEDENTKIWPFYFGMRIKRSDGYDFVDFTNPPMAHMTTEKDIEEYPYWPDLNTNIMEGVIENAKYLHEKTDYYVVGDTPFAYYPLNGYGFNSGMEKWLLDMKIRPKFYHKLCEKFLEANLAFTGQFYKGIGKYVDAATVYDDLGTQESTLMSLSDYREFYKPYQVEIIKNIRKYLRPEAKILLHSDGAIHEFLPDLIEIGVQIIDGVQPLAKNMEPWRLKKDFGDQLAFLGGFDIEQLMPLGTVSEIEEGTKRLISEYASGGGYIFAPSVIIQPETPPENIIAAFDAALKYGKYPVNKIKDGIDYISYIKGLELGKRSSLLGKSTKVC